MLNFVLGGKGGLKLSIEQCGVLAIHFALAEEVVLAQGTRWRARVDHVAAPTTFVE